jgi:hypothetical protein
LLISGVMMPPQDIDIDQAEQTNMSHSKFFMIAPVYMIKSHPGPRKMSNLRREVGPLARS